MDALWKFDACGRRHDKVRAVSKQRLQITVLRQEGQHITI
jgi:hypothetical protein